MTTPAAFIIKVDGCCTRATFVATLPMLIPNGEQSSSRMSQAVLPLRTYAAGAAGMPATWLREKVRKGVKCVQAHAPVRLPRPM